MKKHLKSLFRLYKKLDYKISHTLAVRARSRRRILHIYPTLKYGSDLSSFNLIKTARQYDIKEFFQYKSRPYKDSMNIRYRVALATYNAAKLIILMPLRLIYKAVRIAIKT